MAEKWYTQNYLNHNVYYQMVRKHGMFDFPPVVVTNAITGGIQGKESNPALPQTIPEQLESMQEAYKAGAHMFHIHVREPDTAFIGNTDKPELYKEINAKARELMPDVIINNTCGMGRSILYDDDGAPDHFGPWVITSAEACPEVASVDISTHTSSIPMKAQPPVHPEPWIRNGGWVTTLSSALESMELLAKYGVKPEFEVFSMQGIWYLIQMQQQGWKDPFNDVNWLQFVFTAGSNWPTPHYFHAMVNACPDKTALGVVATGTQQWNLLALALVYGCHVRVGFEDNTYITKGKLAASNAEFVEKARRMAGDIGRRIATIEEARDMLGIPVPRTYNW